MRARDRSPSQLERLAALALGGGRLAIGAGLWLAPRRSAQALGFTDLDQAGMTLARIAATRDLVLGAWQLSAREDRTRLSRISKGVAIADAGDALAFGVALGQTNEAARRAGIRGLAAAAPAAALGFWLAHRTA